MLIFTENRRRSTGLAVTTNPRVIMSSRVSGPSGPANVQTVTTSTGTISSGTDILVVNRSAPSTTALTLPDASGRNGRKLVIKDYSSSVTAHTITVTPSEVSQKIDRMATWTLNSIGDGSATPSFLTLSSATFQPIVDPDDSDNYVWIIAS